MPYVVDLSGPGSALLAKITKPGTALNTMATASLATGTPMPIFYAPAPAPAADGQVMYASPGIAPQSSSKTMLVVAIAGAVGLGAYLMTRKRGR